MGQHDEIWNYGDVGRTEDEIVGYDVVATDGEIGEIEEETIETDRAHLVVDTGFWLFGTKRLVPAGAVTAIDPVGRTVHLRMTKEQVKASPEYEPSSPYDEAPDRHRAYFSGIAWARM